MNPSEKLGWAVKAGRKWRRLSQQELADLLKAGVGKSQLSKLENGQSNPTLESIVGICDALGAKLVIRIEGSTVQEFQLN